MSIICACYTTKKVAAELGNLEVCDLLVFTWCRDLVLLLSADHAFEVCLDVPTGVGHNQECCCGVDWHHLPARTCNQASGDLETVLIRTF